MAFTPVNDGDLAVAPQVQQLIDALQGVAGAGQPISLTALNSASYALSVRNRTGNHFRVLESGSDTVLFAVTDDGITVGTLTVSNPFAVPAGTASAPGLFFAGDANNGWYSPGTDQQAWTTAGTKRALIDASGNLALGYTAGDAEILYVDRANGRVGILDTTPSVALDVTGAIAATATITGAGLASTSGLTVSSGATTLQATTVAAGGIAITGDSTLADRIRIAGAAAYDATDTTPIGSPSGEVKVKVAGSVRMTAGGLVFPDGSTQTQAAATGVTLSAADSDIILDADTDSDGAGEILFKTRGSTKVKIPSLATAGGVLELVDAATPSAATSGSHRLYVKSNHSFYGLTSGGVESQLFDSTNAARRNRLIGGSAQLWELGTSPTATDNAYIGGNWRVLMEAANACTVTRESSDLPTSGARRAWKLAAGSGSNNKFGLFCVIEGADIWDLRGSIASLQGALKIGGTLASMKMAILVWTGTEDAATGDPISAWGSAGTNPTLAANWAYVGTPTDLSATTSWATYYPTQSGSISGSATNLAVMIWTDDKTTTQTTDYFLLTDVQLESGAASTIIDRRKLSEEKRLDRWYGEVLGGSALFERFGAGGAESSTTASITVTFDEKRAAPSMSLSGASDFGVTDGAGGVITVTGNTFAQIGTRSAAANVTVASGLTAGRDARLLANNTTSARIFIGSRI